MRSDKIDHKTVTFILNFLLGIGVILSIATIDRARWIPSYLAYLSSGGDAWNNDAGNILSNGGDAEEKRTDPQPQDACVVTTQLVVPGWYDTYLLVNEYNNAMDGKSNAAGGSERQVICGK